MISVIIPTLGRAGRLPAVVANIREATQAEHELLVVAEHDDEETLLAAGRLPGVTAVTNARSRSYAGAVNTAYPLTRGEQVFAGSDDLRFHPGWDTAALAVLGDGIMVAGTNDLLNEVVARGWHATHYLIDRRYIDGQGGVWDGPPGVVLNESYDHNFTDTEFISVARRRRVFAPCLAAVVEHLHLNNGKSPDDATYQKGRARILADEALYRSREPMWADEFSRMP